jgi:hypothetical protein
MLEDIVHTYSKQPLCFKELEPNVFLNIKIYL